MPFAIGKNSHKALGGSELMMNALEKRLNERNPNLLDNFQIFVSRVHEPLSDKHIRILWLHDLADDPESSHLAHGGYKKFHKLICCSHWQMRGFIEKYNIPWSKFIVLNNCIEPIQITLNDKNRETIKLIYHTTPHRGLQILVPVFKKLKETFNNIELDVYSSFKIYGWEQRDEPYQNLFDECKNTPGINYHGTVSNKEIHEALKTSHIYAYPNIWQETSCISLIEAMSAGLICVHPNYGALPETSANWTNMYQWNENIQEHANVFYTVLKSTIENIISMSEENYWNKINIQKSYIDIFHNWDNIIFQWETLLNSLKDLPKDIPETSFIYRTN